MSKIYKALEKAEKERERESKKDFPTLPEFQEIEAALEKQEVRIKPPKMDLIISKQPLVSYSQPGSLAAEQVRKLRAYLMRLKSPDSLRTIMVTSATTGEGKTLVAANLAASIANDLHTQSLLVDCDLRNPYLSEWFDLPKNRGLSDYLGGNGAASSEFIVKTGLEKLNIFPAGTLKENPAELIASKKMEHLVQELKLQQSNRYVILDSTPILATTEPEVMCKLVDGIIFVVRAGVTPRETVQQAIHALDTDKIIGVVLNDLVFKSPGLHSRYFGSGGYYYMYGYGKRGQESQKNGKWFRWLHFGNRKQ
jgi:protein-tyrosine kinase